MQYLLYDFMQVAGGAERLTLTLAKHIPDVRLVVNRVYSDAMPLMSSNEVVVTQLGNRFTRWMARIPEAIFNFRFRMRFPATVNAVIYSGFYAPLAVNFQNSGLRVYYCHTIPRFAYDLYPEARASFHWTIRWLFDCFVKLLRSQYEASIAKMDVILVNSENIQERLRRFLGVNGYVVHPPVATTDFKWLKDDGYYLSVARLVPNKRVDVIVQAFLEMPERRLVVVSGGPELDRLKLIAQSARNIEFVGWQSEACLRRWIGNAHATIYMPVDEDFGLSPVESMSAGKPVIGVAEGGLLETVLHGKTGWLIEGPPSPAKVQNAVQMLEGIMDESTRRHCELRAQQFDERVFASAVKGYISRFDSYLDV